MYVVKTPTVKAELYVALVGYLGSIFSPLYLMS